MKTYYFKIRDKFIDNVINGTKKHEYRLRKPGNDEIKVGDCLVLVSNQISTNYARVTVKKITHYENWNDALINNWELDFKGLFDNLEQAIKECDKFYTRDEIRQYGILCFDIEPIIVDYSKASVLLDTNIIIKRESDTKVSFEVSKLFNWFDKLGVKKYIHKLSSTELAKYKEKEANHGMMTKLNSYDELVSSTNVTDAHFDSIVSKFASNENDVVDNAILKEVYNDNVDVLLTDDKLLLHKACLLYLRDRVVSSTELLNYYERLFPNKVEYKMLSVKLKEFGEVDLNSTFFDSLREDYGGQKFDRWYKNKANLHEQAYVFEQNNQLHGFLYLKVEDKNEKYTDITPKMSPKRRMKIGTFKVVSTGFKLGERFLKIIFDNAIKLNVEEIYVTLYENKRSEVKLLKELLEKWGFSKFGYKDDGEAVLIKKMDHYDYDKDPIFNFPIVKEKKDYYILPIFPKYHTDLFPDNILQNENMHLYEDNLAHRYAIEKIYLSGSYNIDAKPGDLLLIYRTGDYYPKKYTSVISGVAIVQEIINCKSYDELLKYCKDRSVFSKEEILSFEGKYKTIVKLLHYKTFENKVICDQLIKMGIVGQNSGPRPFTKVTEMQYNYLYKLGTKNDEI